MMALFGIPEPEKEDEHNWRRKLDTFVKEHKQELAALSWGLYLERGQTTDEIIGIDIVSTPRFVYCKRHAIEELNHQVKNHIQEILGILDAHQPEKEVIMIGIGEGEIKLVQFEPEPEPPICLEQTSEDVYQLLELLEKRLLEHLQN